MTTRQPSHRLSPLSNRKPRSMGIQNSMCRTMRRRRRLGQRNHGFRASSATISGPPFQQGDISEDAQNTSLDKLPEDILRHIHSLVPLRDAARAACVSRGFLRSWRCFPNLIFTLEALGLKEHEGTADERAKKLVDRVHHILQNHSGIGVKALQLKLYPCHNVVTAYYVNSWFQVAVKPGIMELVVQLPLGYSPLYNFPSSLPDEVACSLQALWLSCCDFHPTVRTGCWRSLTCLVLQAVRITGEELGCFFSSASALEELALVHCSEMAVLKIPSLLHQLSILKVCLCRMVQVIESDAPKLSTFMYSGPPIKISFGDSLGVKNIHLNGSFYSGVIQYARTRLPSIALNLQVLTLSSPKEAFNTPMTPDKFLHLKHLNIYLTEESNFTGYDFFPLVSFLEASPALESFFLRAGEHEVRHDSVLGDSNGESLQMRRIPEFRHDNLKKLSISGFCSAKSLIELTCQILENTSSLQLLVLDTTLGYDNTDVELGRCRYMSKQAVIEAHKAVKAARLYIKEKVPSSVRFKVWEPCSRCHTGKR